MGHLLREAGYETVYGGKIHLPYGDKPQGMKQVDPMGFDLLCHDSREGLADASAEFLRRKHDKPFLLVASFINPHDICYMAIREGAPGTNLARNTPAALLEAITPPDGVSEEVFVRDYCPPLPDNFEPSENEPEAINELVNTRGFRRYVRDHWPQSKWRIHRWAYCRLTERVDAEIATVLAALADRGPDDDTVVIFTSDHGDLDSAHRLEHKSVLYEEAVHVPLIIARRGHTPSGTVDDTHLACNGLDLIPTLCDYAGVEPPANLPGQSLRPLAEGQPCNDWRQDLLIESHLGDLPIPVIVYETYEKGVKAAEPT